MPRDLVGAVWDSHHPYRVGETPDKVYANLSPRMIEAPEVALPQHLDLLAAWLESGR